MDGIAYKRSSNLVTDALPGVSLNLKKVNGVSNPSTSVYLTRDTSTVRANVVALVQAYNDAKSMLGVVSDPKSSVETYGATLVNDSLVSNMRNQLREMFMSDSSTPGVAVKSLRDLGISLDMTGAMTLDNAKLDTALQTNFDDVVTTFTANQNNRSATSPLTTQSVNAESQNAKYADQLAALQTRMDDLLARYTKQFSVMESLVGSINSQKTSLKSTFDGMMSMYTND